MQPSSQHQCLIYTGSPSRHLSALAAVTRDKLLKHHRCLYLNSPPMIAGIRSYLAASGVDVAGEVRKRSLILSSDRPHLVSGHFDSERMVRALDDAVAQALSDGYVGLWATGDMTWEIGAEKDMRKLLDYEWKLEDLFRRQPCLFGICQYHADTLPQEAVRKGLSAHRSIFINETLSRLNPHYATREAYCPNFPLQDLQSVINDLSKQDQK